MTVFSKPMPDQAMVSVIEFPLFSAVFGICFNVYSPELSSNRKRIVLYESYAEPRASLSSSKCPMILITIGFSTSTC